MDKLKQKILQTAAQMFWNIGIKRVGIDDICNELRISKKTFYTVFKTKSELIESILANIREESKNQKNLDCHNSNINIIDFMLQKGYIFKQKSKEKEKFLHINYDLKKYYPEIYDNHCKEMRENSKIVVLDILQKGVEQGFFRNNMDMTLMQELISEVFSQTIHTMHEKKISWSTLMDFCIDTMLRIVCNENGMEYYLKTKQ
jgi:AcrR family transcriptional regulator